MRPGDAQLTFPGRNPGEKHTTRTLAKYNKSAKPWSNPQTLAQALPVRLC